MWDFECEALLFFQGVPETVGWELVGVGSHLVTMRGHVSSGVELTQRRQKDKVDVGRRTNMAPRLLKDISQYVPFFVEASSN